MEDCGCEVRLINEIKGRGLIATKQFKQGDVLFSEKPLVSCQFPWNEAYGYLACHHCMSPLENVLQCAARLSNNPAIELAFTELDQPPTIYPCSMCGVKYCSTECQVESYNQYHRTMCLGTTEIVEEHPLNILVEAWKKFHYPPETCSILLLVRIVATIQQSDNSDATLNEFMQFCHRVTNDKDRIVHKLLGQQFEQQIEQMRLLFINAISTEKVDHWCTPEGFRSLFALLGTNCQGIGTNAVTRWYNRVQDFLKTNTTISEEEKDRFETSIDKLYYEDFENATGSDFLDNEGSGLFKKQSLINHSCTPNAEVCFLNDNFQLSIRALKDIECEEEICISYLPPCQLEDSDREERQETLSENYLFICRCSRCETENDVMEE
ncbi:SET and MYND domain-containing protein 5 [Chrysoperla carnea]|uniref:SET and MYND domain-containing protein 5 n=1 Tax=Chrysoperla carnea TaxID=189513 RepID=UPI001D092CFF|nr:SET and MYND domain-containing protein 5 [Chrysoperla carnea]